MANDVRTRWLLTGLVLCCATTFIVAQSQPPTPAPAKVIQNPQAKSSPETQKAKDNQSPSSELPPALLKDRPIVTSRDQKQPSANHENQPPYQWWNIGSNITVAIFTGALAWIAFLQWRTYRRQAGYMERGLEETRRSVDASTKAASAAEKAANIAEGSLLHAQDSMRVGERAYIVVKDFEHDRQGPRVGIRYQAKVLWENTGKTPSKEGRTFMRIAVLSNEPDEFDQMETLAESAASTAILGAGKTGTTTHVLTLGVSVEERADIDSGRRKLFIYGVYIYKDIFNKRHITHMSHFFEPAIGLFSSSGTGNSIE